MGCGCDKLSSKPPYANLNDVQGILDNLCEDCVVEVPNGTTEANFVQEGWGGTLPECCQEYTVYVATTEEIWKSKDGASWCNICGNASELENRCVAIVPPTTLEADFLSVGFGGTVPSGCKELTVLYSDNSNVFMQVAGETNWNSIVKRIPPVYGRRWVDGGTLEPAGSPGATFGTIDVAKSKDPLGLFGVTGRTITIPSDVKGTIQILHNVVVDSSNVYIYGDAQLDNTSTTEVISAMTGFAQNAGSFNGGLTLNLIEEVDEDYIFYISPYASATTTILWETITYLYWEEL